MRFLFAVILLSLAACGTSKPYLSDTYRINPPQHQPVGQLTHQLFLIGDAGYVKEGDALMQLFKRKVQEAGSQSTTIFLGDNIYPAGLPDSTAADYAQARQALVNQLEAVKQSDGRIIFIPGNHDWNDSQAGGTSILQNQERFVENYLNKGNTFLPDNGFPGPIDIELAEDLVLIVIDTEWLLRKEEKPFGDTGEYNLRGPVDFYFALRDKLQQHKDKRIIVAAHHPLFSNGEHGGHFAIKDYFFPLTHFNKKAYIALPGIGALYPLTRKYIGADQDITASKYRLMQESLSEFFEQHADSLIYVSGHEHNLQVIRRQKTHYLVSGSGSDVTYLRKGNADFSYRQRGFMNLKYYDSGEIFLEVWTSDNGGTMSFSKRIRGVNREKIKIDAAPMPPPNLGDVVQMPANATYQQSGTLRSLGGRGHRKVWTTPINVPTFDIGTIGGGLKPLKRGGGMQTISIRLADAQGREYALRSVDKDPIQSVPKPLRSGFAGDFVVGQTAAIHPYAAMAVPRLADAAGIYHPNPKVFYVPKNDARFGVFKEIVGVKMFLFEEYPMDGWLDATSFGKPNDIVSSDKFYRKITEENDHRVDQPFFARNRLFDMLLADWDRHAGQYRWAAFEPEDEKGKIYRPIPRDRDNVFCNYDSPVLKFGAKLTPILAKFQTFGADYGDIVGLTRNGIDQDRRLTNALTKSEWMRQARLLQAQLTDEVLVAALRDLPSGLPAETANQIRQNFRSRRAKLHQLAATYYDYLAQKVDVIGSHKSEKFEVTRINDEVTEVVVYDLNKEGENKQVIYRRTFFKSETKEIRLYGLGGKDYFEIKGNVKNGIKIITVGGIGNDTYADYSNVSQWQKAEYFDTTEGNTVIAAQSTRVHTTDNPRANLYDQNNFASDHTKLLWFSGYTSEEGVYLGGGKQYIYQGFLERPYRISRAWRFNFAPRTQGFNFGFKTHRPNLDGRWGLRSEVDWRMPQGFYNYYALGNESAKDSLSKNYWNANIQRLKGAVQIEKTGYENSLAFRLGAFVEGVFPLEQIGHVQQAQPNGLLAQPYKIRYFTGAQMALNLEAVDNPLNPTQGFKWLNSAEVRTLPLESFKTHAQLSSIWSLYLSPKISPQLTFALRSGIKHNIGDFPFYAANTIGGLGSLRGFHSRRFAGRTAWFNNVELRKALVDLQTNVGSFTLGGLGFADGGRVWSDGENSKTFHVNYGGGVWLLVPETIVVSTGFAFSKEHQGYFFGKLGFMF